MRYIIITFFYLQIFNIHSSIGQNKTDTKLVSEITINSNLLSEDRTCLISLPESYYNASEMEKKYPIIILLDGNTHFKTASGIVHFMSADRLRNHQMPETIIIAIENVDRERDFTITKIKTKRPNTMGGGRNFLNFIEKELIPHIDKNYRTEADRTLIGHSLGALLVINSYLDKNSIFDAFISIDPSLWWNEEMMKSKVESISPKSLHKRLYIATANQGEANYERNKKRHDAFYSLIKIKSVDQLNVKIEYFENEDHRSVPLVAIYEGLKYLNQEN